MSAKERCFGIAFAATLVLGSSGREVISLLLTAHVVETREMKLERGRMSHGTFTIVTLDCDESSNCKYAQAPT